MSRLSISNTVDRYRPILSPLTLGDERRDRHVVRRFRRALGEDGEIPSCVGLHDSDRKTLRDRLRDVGAPSDPLKGPVSKARGDQVRGIEVIAKEQCWERSQDARRFILYFGPRVRDAECMAYLLRERKIPAAVVSGSTRDETRRALIDRFRRNELRVLCNCEVLTTGFDAPRVTHIVMARPTMSHVLYEQMVGRGLRGPKFGGTETCTILDCIDELTGRAKPQLGYTRFREVWKRRRRTA
jgi:superfamily II DNA or RNA helicase